MVIAVAVLLSGVMSLSLTPLLASRWLRTGRVMGGFSRCSSVASPPSSRPTRAAWPWFIDRRGLALWVGAALIAGTGAAYVCVDKGFVPLVDSGKIDGDTRAPEGTPYAAFAALQNRIATLVREDPDVAGVVSVVGTADGPGNSGHLIIGLKPRAERRGSADDVIRRVRDRAKAVQGLEFTMRNPPAIDMGPQLSPAGVQYVLQSTDRDALQAAAETLARRLSAVPQVQDVSSDLQLRNPEIRVALRRDEAAALGISPAKLQDMLQSAFGGRRVGSIYGASDQYPVILQLERRAQADEHALDALTLPGSSGDMVPLGAVADLQRGVGPIAVNHYGSLPSVTLSFNLAPGVSLGEASQAVDAAAAEVLEGTDARVTGRFAGTAQAFQDSLRDLPLLLLATVVLIYMILAVLYEDAWHPLTILTALPLAAFGALWMLVLLRFELNLFSFVGLILLVGLVKKNGIMMVDFALELERLRRGGPHVSARDSMLQACRVRFRPIMMTTCAAVLGALPIALGAGAGAEARRPLGIAVVGGLVFSQWLTLYLTPAFHVALDDWRSARPTDPSAASAGKALQPRGPKPQQ